MAASRLDTPFELRHLTALIGPYGSGKTELAIGLATRAAALMSTGSAAGARPVLGDLDVLKPYFRSREAELMLARAGVDLVAPKGALSMSDLPIIPAELRGAVGRPELRVVLDVGGDPVGARALGSLSDVIAQTDYDLLLVLNRNRPFMNDVDKVIAHARDIVRATHLDLTGIISNTHMLDETTASEALEGLELARTVASAIGVPVRLLAVPERLVSELEHVPSLPPLFAITRRMLPSFLGGVVLARPNPALSTGSLP